MALSGLGRSLGKLTQFELSFGLWLESMPDALVWTYHDPGTRMHRAAPTRSWLSLKPSSNDVGVGTGSLKA